MSRTYREFFVSFCSNCHKPSGIRVGTHIKGHPEICDCDPLPNYWYSGVNFHYKRVKTSDHKPWYKPPKGFKQMRRREFRSKVKQALHNHIYKGKDFIPPVNKKGDIWEWS